MYTISWEPKARKQLTKIDRKATRNEIYKTVENLADFPAVLQVKKLTNHQHD